MFADFGYTGGQSLSRKNNFDGVSQPIIKSGTSELRDLLALVHQSLMR